MSAVAQLFAVVLSASSVESVVVYPDRAEVTRGADVSCKDGHALFEGIPPAADPASFRGAVSGGKLAGFRSVLEQRTQAYSAERDALEKQLEALEHDRAAATDQLTQAQTEQKLGGQYAEVMVGGVSREMAVSKPDPKAWQSAVDGIVRTEEDAAQKVVDAQARLRELGEKIEDLDRKLSSLDQAAAKSQWKVELDVACPQGSSAHVVVRYMVGGASWTPSYEARAKADGTGAELSMFGSVEQHTGEAWKGARLLLSTAVPGENATPPELSRLFVQAQKHEAEQKVLVRRDEQITHAEVGAAAQAPGGGLSARAQGLSVQFTVPGASDVPADGSAVRLFVAKQSLPGRLVLRTSAAQLPYVFRVADLTNTAPWPILAGEIFVFGQSGLWGKLMVPRVPAGGLFHLTFGLEDGIRVKRIPVQEVKKDPNFFGTKRRFNYTYRTDVANHLGRAVTVEVQERIPVSEIDDVTVGVDESTTSGYQLAKEDGVLTWPLKLGAGKTENVLLSFHVEVPKSYESGGL